MKLSSSQIQQFEDQGHLKLEGLFSASELVPLRQAFDRLYAKALELGSTQIHGGTQYVVEGDQVHRIVWCGASEPALLSFVEDERYIAPVQQLLGHHQMHHLINQAHFKMPGDEVQFDWHQDSEHRRYGTPLWTDSNGRGSYVQTLLALDEMGLENGPLQVVAGSQRFGHIGRDLQDHPERYVEKNQLQQITMKPGDLLLFGPYLIHSSAPNRGSFSRRVFINGFAHPQANKRVYPGEGAGRLLPQAS